MNSKKIISDILGVQYTSVKKIIDPLYDGQTITIGEYIVTSLYRKTVSGKDTHYIKIQKGGKFVGQVGLEQ